MANEGNLKPVRTKSEARERGRSGGIASGEARRQKKMFRDRLEQLYEKTVFPGEKTELEDVDSITELAEENTSVIDTMAVRVIQMALSGDQSAIKLALSITGQMEPPKEEIEVMDDGFLEALSGTAAEDWAEGDDGET